MKHSDRLHDDELHYLDSINRMTRQLHIRNRDSSEESSNRLQITVEELEEQLESIRRDQDKQYRR